MAPEEPVANPSASEPVAATLPRSRRSVYLALLFIYVVALLAVVMVVGYRIGGVPYKWASEGERTVTFSLLLEVSARVGIVFGLFMGAISGLASVPGVENDLKRIFTRRVGVAIGVGTVIGGVIGAIGVLVYCGAWFALSQFDGVFTPEQMAGFAGCIAVSIVTVLCVLVWKLAPRAGSLDD